MSTIMLVDDSATILLSISNILSKAGYTVEKASNAQAGLDKFKGGIKVNLLITDLNMPSGSRPRPPVPRAGWSSRPPPTSCSTASSS